MHTQSASLLGARLVIFGACAFADAKTDAAELKVKLTVEPGLELAEEAWREPYKFLLLARAANAVPEAHAFRAVVVGADGELQIASLGNGFITDASLRVIQAEAGLFGVKANVNILGLQKEVVGQARADFGRLRSDREISLTVDVPEAVFPLIEPRAQRFFGKILTPQIQQQIAAYLNAPGVVKSEQGLVWSKILSDAKSLSWRSPTQGRECEPGQVPSRWQQIQAAFIFTIWAFVLPLFVLIHFVRSASKKREPALKA